MATETDPLRRTSIGVVAQLPGARLAGPRTNSALQLAESLRDINPEARQLMQGIAEDRAAKAQAQAKKDAIEASGSLLADAVREGKIKPTQNPWYVQAYNREAAAIRAQSALQDLQVQSTSWEEQDDPQAFNERWRKEVGAVSEGFDGEDYAAGFTAVEGAVTSQVLQSNVARNSARIETERTQNLAALSTDALQQALRQNGGALTPNQAWAALAPAREQWFSTGGDETQWNKIIVGAVTSAAYGAKDKNLLDLLKAPELLHGPSEIGGVGPIGTSGPYQGPVNSIKEVPVPPSVPGGPAATKQVVVATAPVRRGFTLARPVEGPVTSGYGQRKRPMKGASTSHLAIDIGGKLGTPIKAQATGKVVSAGRNGGLGLSVRVDYGNGVQAIYSHLNSVEVKPGDLVAAGQKVGGMGKTGIATGVHLDYRVEVNGKRVNPETFNGQVGGEFEGQTPAEVPQAQVLPGFPGQDQPFDTGQQAPVNRYGAGPSLYGMPGVADQVESDRYRIGEAAMAQATEQMRLLDGQRSAKGYQGRDFLYQKYGTAVITGGVTRQQMVEDLSAQGLSVPEIAKALNFLNNDLGDSVGVANAQVTARGQDPGTAKALLDLQVRGATQGYTEEYGQQVGQLVLDGTISGNDARSMIGGALNKSDRDEAEQRTDAREQRAQQRYDESQKLVGSYSDLREEASNLVARVISKGEGLLPGQARRFRDPNLSKRYLREVQGAMQAHLAAHPKDWDGALAAGKAAAAYILNNLSTMAEGGTVSKQPSSSAAPSSGSNPRR